MEEPAMPIGPFHHRGNAEAMYGLQWSFPNVYGPYLAWQPAKIDISGARAASRS
jgi:hypothetical protein